MSFGARAAWLVVLAGACKAEPASPPSDDAGAHDGSAAIAIGLKPEARERLTTVRVSAHVGSVIIRKEAEGWVLSGRDGCVVAPRRMALALDNLTTLRGAATNEAAPPGHAFELQIAALVGEDYALQLDVAERNSAGDLTRLANDSAFRIQGLDRKLWSAQPADWCR